MSRPAVACENTRTEGPAQWRKSLDQRAVGSIRPRADPGEQSVIGSTGNARDSASSPIYAIGQKAILIAPEMRNLVNLPSRLSQRRSSAITVASHTPERPGITGVCRASSVDARHHFGEMRSTENRADSAVGDVRGRAAARARRRPLIRVDAANLPWH